MDVTRILKSFQDRNLHVAAYLQSVYSKRYLLGNPPVLLLKKIKSIRRLERNVKYANVQEVMPRGY